MNKTDSYLKIALKKHNKNCAHVKIWCQHISNKKLLYFIHPKTFHYTHISTPSLTCIYNKLSITIQKNNVK